MNELYISECGRVIIELLSPLNYRGEAHIKFREVSDSFDLMACFWEVDQECHDFQVIDGFPITFMPLHQYYVQQIASEWRFDKIKSECLSYLSFPSEHSDFEEPQGRCLLGSVFNLTPSGKYYLPFACSNVTEFEAEKDEIWNDAMIEVFEAHGFYLTPGEGDPCDIFAGAAFSWQEIAEANDLSLPIDWAVLDEYENMDEQEALEQLVRANVREV